MKVPSTVILLIAIVSLADCKPKPTEAQLRALDEKAMADFENESLEESINTSGLNRDQAEQKLANDRETERSINNADTITPAEAKLLDDYNKHPKETLDRLCDEVTKDGC